jgi:hypothetical protein
MRKGLLAAAAAAVALTAGAAGAAGPRDYASVALDILPPGENGGLTFTRNTTDQAKLYDALTPLRGDVTDAALHAYFKPETLGAPVRPARVERLGRATILRDSFGVLHVVGRTQADVEYGAGWATAEDRGLLLGLIRGPARVAALDIPGVDPLGLALSGTTFSPSAQTEAFLAKQTALLPRSYRALLQAYVAGINAHYRKTGTPTDPYTTNDVVAAAALIAARFGANGGQEATNAAFLSALQAKFGADRGRRIFDDLREANDPEAPVSLPGSFPQEPVFSPAPGSVVLDDGSFGVAGVSERQSMSNALLVSARRSATGHPLFVAPVQERVPRDDDLRRRRAQEERRARPRGRLPRDRARARAGVRASGRAQGRARAGAVDARARARVDPALLPARHAAGALGEAVPADDGRSRVRVQVVLRRLEGHRDVLVGPAAGAGRRNRPGAAHRRDRRLRLAGVPDRRAARAGDQPALGRDPELEQQAGRRRGGRPTRTGATGRSSASGCSRTESRRSRSTRSRRSSER